MAAIIVGVVVAVLLAAVASATYVAIWSSDPVQRLDARETLRILLVASGGAGLAGLVASLAHLLQFATGR